VVSGAVVAGQFVIVIHLDSVERAELGAQAAVHTDVDVDVELLRCGLGAAGLRVGAAHDPDALRRADLGADAATGAPVLAGGLFRVQVVDDQKGGEAEAFRNGDLFLRVFNREQPQPAVLAALAEMEGGIGAFTLAQEADVIDVCIKKMLERDPHPFKNAQSVHIISLAGSTC